MNYDRATNKELSVRLAELLRLDVDWYRTGLFESLTESCRSSGIHIEESEDGCLFIDGEFVNYCTNWNATMPLADEHEIQTASWEGLWMAGYYDLSFAAYKPKVCHYDGSRLRAIVICLIKKLELEKSK